MSRNARTAWGVDVALVVLNAVFAVASAIQISRKPNPTSRTYLGGALALFSVGIVYNLGLPRGPVSSPWQLNVTLVRIASAVALWTVLQRIPGYISVIYNIAFGLVVLSQLVAGIATVASDRRKYESISLLTQAVIILVLTPYLAWLLSSLRKSILSLERDFTMTRSSTDKRDAKTPTQRNSPITRSTLVGSSIPSNKVSESQINVSQTKLSSRASATIHATSRGMLPSRPPTLSRPPTNSTSPAIANLGSQAPSHLPSPAFICTPKWNWDANNISHDNLVENRDDMKNEVRIDLPRMLKKGTVPNPCATPGVVTPKTPRRRMIAGGISTSNPRTKRASLVVRPKKNAFADRRKLEARRYTNLRKKLARSILVLSFLGWLAGILSLYVGAQRANSDYSYSQWFKEVHDTESQPPPARDLMGISDALFGMYTFFLFWYGGGFKFKAAPKKGRSSSIIDDSKTTSKDNKQNANANSTEPTASRQTRDGFDSRFRTSLNLNTPSTKDRSNSKSLGNRYGISSRLTENFTRTGSASPSRPGSTVRMYRLSTLDRPETPLPRRMGKISGE
ncbi:hypothetical protein AAMO2058_000471000 [Amorphochlora amoebiformis]